MRLVVTAMAAVAVCAALSAPAGAHVEKAGPWCGGTLWKLMTLSDTGRTSVKWTPAATSIPDIAKLAAPAKSSTARGTAFQKQLGQVSAVLERYRLASNGEVVLQLFDIDSGTYMNAYMPSSQCLPATTRGRAQILAARNAFVSTCPAPHTAWQMLG